MTTTVDRAAFPWQLLLTVLAVALIGRVLVLATGAVSFHSDEAVVALMARHILEGERPVFFYGQAYMGSLDAWLVAVGFRLLGDTVGTIRIVQAVLYLGVVASSFYAAWRLSGRALVALVASLTLAVPPVMVTVYTAATLGGYNETLIFGNLLLALGYDVSHEHRRSLWRWALFGLVGGVAWWTNGLIVAFAAPVALLVFWRILRPAGGETRPLAQRAAPLLLTVVMFFVGSAPWWVFNFEHDFAALSFYVSLSSDSEFAGNDLPLLPFDQRLLGIVFLGLPTLFGMRFPWEPTYFVPIVGALLFCIYALAFFRLVRRSPAADGALPLKPDAASLVLGMTGIFAVIFLVSKFSIDPTGRYFLPFAIPFGIALGVLIVTFRFQRRQMWQLAVASLVLTYSATGVAVAVTREPGLTTQFYLTSHIPHTHDEALMTFLDEHELYSGYTTYWVAFRLAFLSNEQMQYSSALPYKPSLEYTEADERYIAYKRAADANPNPAYITANVVEVQARLEALFAEQALAYEREQIGPYTVYWNFEPAAPRPPLALAE